MNKTYLYGFTRNEMILLMPAVRYVWGNVKPYILDHIEETHHLFCSNSMVIINGVLPFYELEHVLQTAKREGVTNTACISWQTVPGENIEIMLNYAVKSILFDLESEEEFSFCRQAIIQGKTYRAKNTYKPESLTRCADMEIYEKLTVKQKEAFVYMMLGKTQKEFTADFAFNSMNTAATHWHETLKKFNVHSVNALLGKFSITVH